MAVSRSIWQHIQQSIWLAFAIICLIAALVFWGMIDRGDVLIEVKQAKTETQVQIQPEKVAATAHLGALSEEVKPLDLTTRVVVANEHAPEFRGTKFIKENQRQWTVEIFRSSDEAIVKNFLLNRADRKKFSYLRLNSPDQAEQYVLIYGLFANADDANQQFAQLGLTLPKSIQAKAQLLSSYSDLVNDLGSDEMKLSSSPLYAIQLKPAALPKVDETFLLDTTRALRKPSHAGNRNSNIDPLTAINTTVTQRDAQGNVVNVKQSQSTLPANQSAEKVKENSNGVGADVSDPFN